VYVLFVVFEFPPYSTGGVHRPLKIINQLQGKGITPIVVTIDHEKVYSKTECDFYLNDKIGKGIKVYRTDFNDSGLKHRFIDSGYSFQPDSTYIGWQKYFKHRVTQLVEKYHPKAVFVTLPPFSVGKLGIWVKQRFNIPLIVDMRDAWSNWIVSPYASVFHYLQIKKHEHKLLKAADAILATSPQTLKDFQKLYKDIPKSKYHFIANGFEEYLEDNYLGSELRTKVKIGYVGSFYYSPASQKLVDNPWYKKKPYQYFQYLPHKENWLYRSPYFFFRALQFLFEKYPAYRSKVELVFAGRKPNWFDQMVAEFGLEDIINHVGKISQKQSLELQKSCDALLITSAKRVNGFDYSIAGKTFEYFSMKKPIIGFVCPGSQKWILENSGMAILANPDDINSAANDLKLFFDGKVNLTPNNKFIDQFRMNNLIDKLQQVFESLLT
jgi:hypothetical protein